LSDSLGGSCILSGKSPCSSSCPDLCQEYFTDGLCPTPTPTPTLPCNVDFEVLFDCVFTPTPSNSPTPTITPSITSTPTPSDVCSIIGVDADIIFYSPTPTPTPSITPTTSPEVERPCNFTGNVSFNNIDEIIRCPFSIQLQDCYTGEMYFTTNELTNPDGGNLEPFMVFEALIDGVSRCVSYIGDNQNTIGINQVNLRYGSFGFSNLGDCVYCTLFESPTPTPTSTITPTPTLTTTPSSTPVENAYYLYVRCDDNTKYVAQTSPGPSTIPNNSFINLNDNKCWKFLSVSSGIPSINPLFSLINFSGNYFTQTTNQVFTTCELCNLALISTPSIEILSQQSYTINYAITKSVDCSKTTGKILVNGVIKYNMLTGLPAGNYSGSINVNDGDIVTLEFNTFAPSSSCLPLASDITIFDNNGIVSEYAKFGTSNQTIYTQYIVNSNWLGNVLIINTGVS
jgi:hypothetical protein